VRPRNALAVTVLACLLASFPWAQAAQATTKKVHRATGTYASPAVGVSGNGGGSCSQTNGFGCVEFATRPTDRTVSLRVTDQSGAPVYATWGQDYNNDGLEDKTAGFCGKTTSPIPIRGGVRLTVFVWEGPGADVPCAGVATQGTVVARFSS
jgi:hypothetical protein